MKKKFVSFSLISILLIGCLPFTVSGQRDVQKRAKVCGDPTEACETKFEFEPHDISFEVPDDAVQIYETEEFYAVILASVRVTDANCETRFISEERRLETQELFPNNKVFASRCPDPGNLYYEPIDYRIQFMAVYAGKTKEEANELLATVKATGKFSDAFVRQLSAGINGT